MSKETQPEAGASEGARRATAEASASSALVGTGRWSVRRKVSVVIEILKGESLESLSRRHGVTTSWPAVRPASSIARSSSRGLWCMAPDPYFGRASSTGWSCGRGRRTILLMKSKVHPKYKTTYRVGELAGVRASARPTR